VFVRFSAGPAADAAEQSIDYESGSQLPGLSANRLDPESWWSRPLIDWLARQVCQYLHLNERSPDHSGWVLRGRIVGRGPDDEPLLADIDPIAWLGPRLIVEAERLYADRFDQGRISP
jgi:hypothetical protein